MGGRAAHFVHPEENSKLMADLANRHRDRGAEPLGLEQIPIKIDDDGTGNAVGSFLRADGYTGQLIGAGSGPDRERAGRFFGPARFSPVLRLKPQLTHRMACAARAAPHEGQGRSGSGASAITPAAGAAAAGANVVPQRG